MPMTDNPRASVLPPNFLFKTTAVEKHKRELGCDFCRARGLVNKQV